MTFSQTLRKNANKGYDEGQMDLEQLFVASLKRKLKKAKARKTRIANIIKESK